jgi:hypothetical protein
MQTELRRLGCYNGEVNGDWNDGSRRALENFNKHAGVKLDVKVASLDAVDVLRGKSTRVCPLECERGFKAQGEACVKIACPSGQVVNESGACQPRDKGRAASRPESRPAADKPPAPKKSGGGQIVCGAGGCQEIKPGCRAVEQVRSQSMGSSVVCN